jgi:hypothetical protein
MINKLMEDTCLKDMQVTRLSSLKTGKHLRVHHLPKVLRSMGWISSSSGIHCFTLPFSSSSKIFTKLTSTGASALMSIQRPSLRLLKRATSAQSVDTTICRTILFLAQIVNNMLAPSRGPATSHQPPVSSDKRQASSSKLQASSYKLWNFL